MNRPQKTNKKYHCCCSSIDVYGYINITGYFMEKTDSTFNKYKQYNKYKYLIFFKKKCLNNFEHTSLQLYKCSFVIFEFLVPFYKNKQINK